MDNGPEGMCLSTWLSLILQGFTPFHGHLFENRLRLERPKTKTKTKGVTFRFYVFNKKVYLLTSFRLGLLEEGQPIGHWVFSDGT